MFSRWRAALVMATFGVIAAVLAVAAFANFEVEALLIIVPAAGFSAFVSGLVVFPAFARRTSFDRRAAAVGGAVTALAAFPVLTLIVLGIVALDMNSHSVYAPPDAKAWIEIVMLGSFALPALASPIICPIGAVGGLVVRWLHLRRGAGPGSRRAGA